MEWERLLTWFSGLNPKEDTFAGVAIGAHAYAAAVQLYEEARPARVPGAVPRVGSLKESLRALDAAERTLDRYEALLAILVACEADLADPARRAGLPPATTLDGASGLAGVVHHGWRGAAAWRRQRHRRHEELGPGPTSYALRPDDQLDHLWFAWSRGEPLLYAPLVRRGLASRRVVTELGTRLETGSLRVALCPLAGAEGPRFRVVEPGDRFVACREHAPVSEARLGRIARAAAEENVALLLLPELHVRPEELGGLAAEGALLTVAGSFHVGEDELRNRAPVLVDAGHRLWEHDKRGYFRVPGRLAARAGGPFEPAPHVTAEVCEGIVGGGPLTVLDTSLGRLAVVICADALEPDGYVRAVEAARPDLLLVVSLSYETRDFEVHAAQCERLGISTLYVNAGPDHTLRGMCWLAVQGGASLPPTRIRWTGTSLEGWRPGAGRDAWTEDLGGAAWVHPELGLVVDLGVMVSDGKYAAGDEA